MPNEEGSHLTPSVVSFLSDGDYGDGAIAMDALRSDNRGAWVVVGEKVRLLSAAAVVHEYKTAITTCLASDLSSRSSCAHSFRCFF